MKQFEIIGNQNRNGHSKTWNFQDSIILLSQPVVGIRPNGYNNRI